MIRLVITSLAWRGVGKFAIDSSRYASSGITVLAVHRRLLGPRHFEGQRGAYRESCRTRKFIVVTRRVIPWVLRHTQRPLLNVLHRVCMVGGMLISPGDADGDLRSASTIFLQKRVDRFQKKRLDS
jgi:hypothetical protein